MANHLSHCAWSGDPFPFLAQNPDVFEDWPSAPLPYHVIRQGEDDYHISISADGLPSIILSALSGDAA